MFDSPYISYSSKFILIWALSPFLHIFSSISFLLVYLLSLSYFRNHFWNDIIFSFTSYLRPYDSITRVSLIKQENMDQLLFVLAACMVYHCFCYNGELRATGELRRACSRRGAVKQPKNRVNTTGRLQALRRVMQNEIAMDDKKIDAYLITPYDEHQVSNVLLVENCMLSVSVTLEYVLKFLKFV